jgi:hypothetical protein
MEGIDLTDVAAPPGSMNPWVLARGFTRQLCQFGGSHGAEMRGGATEGRDAVGWKNFKTGSNFLYPAGLLLTSKKVGSRSVE